MVYSIQNEQFSALSDSKGAELFSLKDKNGTEYLWQGNPAYWTGRSPHLFPIVGALKENSYFAEGRQYAMGKHGFARHKEFAARRITANSVTFELTQDEQTLQMYPYHFTFHVTHTLTQDGFTTRYSVQNTGDATLPFCAGGHVGINCPLFPGEFFHEYAITFPQAVTLNSLYCPDDEPIDSSKAYPLPMIGSRLQLSHDLFENGALIIKDIPAREVMLLHPASGRGVQLIFEDFPILALWTMPKRSAPYVCLEPWHGLPSIEIEEETMELMEKAYTIKIAPGHTKELAYELNVINSSL